MGVCKRRTTAIRSPLVELKAHADLVDPTINLSLENKPNKELLDLSNFDVKLLNVC
jgi:hypothetical protein